MRKIYAIFSAALLIFAASCEKEDHAVNQRVTYYPVFEVVGGATYAHQVGTPWVDPGINATLKGEPITVETIGEVDASTSGIYQLVYSYTNVDGFENHATRTVVVYDIANAGAADISSIPRQHLLTQAVLPVLETGTNSRALSTMHLT